MAMTTSEVIREFVQGATEGKASGGRLRIEGNRLMNYQTCLAEANPNLGWIVNTTKYSRTTSTHQNRLQRELSERRVFPHYVEDVPEGTEDLVEYMATSPSSRG